MNIATLTIEMAANVARLRQDMENAASVVQATTARMQKAAELAGKALGLIGVGLSLSAFTGFIRNAIDAADALDEMSGRVGVSAKELSGLQLAYKQAGMGNDAMASSLAKLSREMSEGNAGLRALGVNTRNTDGSLRGTTAVLLDVADKFKGMEDGAAKTALAMEIFGKSGAEMVPLLNSGAEGIEELTAMAEKLGLVIEDSTAAQAGKFNDTLELLGLGVQGVGSRIAAQLLPTLTALTGSFLESMTSGDRLKGVADFLAASLKILYSVAVGTVEVFNTLGKSAGLVLAQIGAIMRGDFAGAVAMGREWSQDIASSWSATATTIKAAWNEQGSAVVDAGAAMVKTNKDLLAVEKAREEAAKKAAAAAAKAAEEAKKKAEDGAKLAASLLAQDTGLAGDFAEKWGKLTAAYAANKISLADLTLAQRELLEQQPLMKKAQEEAVKASQAAADARHKEAEGIEAFMRAQEEAAAAAVKSVKDRIGSLEDEERAADLSRSLNISLAEAVERVAIARLQEKQAGFYENSEGWENLRREIEERQKLLGLIARKDVREREERGWTDMWSSVDRTAHDVFVNVFEGGSNVFKKLGQTLKASVLDVLYQMTVRRWIINIGTSIFGGGFGAAAQAATGGSSLLSGIGSIGSGYSLLSGLGGAFGGGMAGGFGGLMGSLGLSSAGTTLGGAMSAGSIALQSGNILGGLGTFAGALGPIALGIGALVSLLGKDTSGTFHTGALSEYSAATGAANSTAHGAFGMGFGGVDFSAQSQQFTAGLAKSITQLLDGTAATFGKGGGYRVATAFADDTSDDGAWGGLLIRRMEETILNWDDTRTSRWAPKEFANGEQGQKEYLAALGNSVRDALDSIGLPGWATTMLDQLGEGASIEQLAGVVEQINNVKAVFADFGQYMPTFASLADEAISKLAQASGGVEALSANMSTFVANFFTEEERLTVATANVTAELAKLGFEMPRSREEFKALVQAQWALGEAGAETAARLLALSGAVSSVTPSLEEAAQAAARVQQEQIEAARRAAEESARAAAAAQKQMLEAQRDALNQQRQLVEETLSNLQGLFELVSSTARELFGQVDELAAMQAAEGRAFISQAIATARASGNLPQQDQLADAISAARGGIDKGAYASGAVQDYERMVLANQMRALESFIGPQKTASEQQLEVLKAQLKSIDDTVKAVNGTTGAVYNLNSALSDYDQQKRIEAVRSAFSSFSDDPLRVASISRAAGWSMQDLASAFSMSLSQVQSYFAEFGISNFSDGATLSTLESRYSEMKSMFASFSDDPWRVYNISKSKGWTTADIAAAYKMPLQQVRDYYLAQGIPAFATGAAFTNGIATRPTLFNMAQMGEVQPEGILPLANVGGRLGVYSTGGGSSDRLVAALIKEVQVLQSKLDTMIDRQEEGNDNTQRHADQFENWTMGGRGSIKAEVKVIA